MKNRLLFALTSSALLAVSPALAQDRSDARVAVAITETISGYNPYSDPVVLLSSVWCQIYGCVTRYDFAEGAFVPYLAESVEALDDLTWEIKLPAGLTRHNGEPVVAADIVHSIEYLGSNPNSGKSYLVAGWETVEAIDDLTVRITTATPDATVRDNLAGVAVTSKALFDAHGEDMFAAAPYGAGPYMLSDLSIGQHIVIARNDGHPLLSDNNPAQIMYRIMPEPEQRVTALANGEVQIAQSVPPQLIGRVNDMQNARVETTNSVEMMFLAMSPKTHPWDIPEARQAVAHAINREAIVRAILQGQANILEGPVSAGQIGHDPAFTSPYDYNPARARELLASVGLEGVEVTLSTPVGRYTADRQITEAMVPMLEEAGFNVTLDTPEWATLWANVQQGEVPFYYMGRGSMIDPSRALHQYFATGGSPRIGFSDPELDALLAAERAAFDPADRAEKMQAAIARLVDQAPAAFMWQHQMAWGVANEITFAPHPADQVNGWEIFID
ncbi:ABC transporter substrate-binding protein [Ketogulonicigenium vulgare]|uniref:ABC-type dipeptide/oligopeptide/nickel transport system, periplasmic component n=1 Tax=Ketogulonicigenium vulgare (strain WSH-001) TaxID=759362 RepID=F9YBC1_KETVW|nr:ABC transporter substrate-binding protein [Ketogulonicigenium vulgare]ADO44150.1 ABC-type dipeptide/oligopeptide/nickel transport systems, periplasmic components [Ketogulonicigenium vulgare Y25]AEM42673.1 ABC-type dipeptide/oligopeptide/nickel transport system, periplasmic component [Ketogulonicigenium vulgare WSH-001]ALJ82478.1 peptide ABC transporter substrate-binding protein [Ketogulonicigenium vulgare]ANW35262.1 peptide ABC transporter substrate-binding protein [Ketogulonicigenium vulgar